MKRAKSYQRPYFHHHVIWKKNGSKLTCTGPKVDYDSSVVMVNREAIQRPFSSTSSATAKYTFTDPPVSYHMSRKIMEKRDKNENDDTFSLAWAGDSFSKNKKLNDSSTKNHDLHHRT